MDLTALKYVFPYLKAVARLERTESPEVLTGGMGFLLTAGLAIPVATGQIDFDQAVAVGQWVGAGIAGGYALLNKIKASRAAKSEQAANSEIQGIQTQLRRVVPGIKSDGQAPAGGKTQAGVEAVVDMIKDRPAAVQYAKSEVARTPAKVRHYKPSNHGNP